MQPHSVQETSCKRQRILNIYQAIAIHPIIPLLQQRRIEKEVKEEMIRDLSLDSFDSTLLSRLDGLLNLSSRWHLQRTKYKSTNRDDASSANGIRKLTSCPPVKSAENERSKSTAKLTFSNISITNLNIQGMQELTKTPVISQLPTSLSSVRLKTTQTIETSNNSSTSNSQKRSSTIKTGLCL
jgi:hypothetical protein